MSEKFSSGTIKLTPNKKKQTIKQRITKYENILSPSFQLMTSIFQTSERIVKVFETKGMWTL